MLFINLLFHPSSILDPITALGLASNIIQLVDFASKLLEKSTEIRRNGEAVDHGRLRAADVDLENLSRSIKTSASVPDNEHSDRAAETPQETVGFIIIYAHASQLSLTSSRLWLCFRKIAVQLQMS